MKRKFIVKSMLFCVFAFAFIMIIKVYANTPNVIVTVSDEYVMNVVDNGERDDKREIMLGINVVKPGKRLVDVKYCLASSNCNSDSNWISVHEYDNSNVITSYQNGIGSDEMTFGLWLPAENVTLKAELADFEPMNISYAKYNETTEDEHEYRDVYVDGTFERENYDENFTSMIKGYRGGDIVLPSDCTNNGCLLKITLDKSDYDSIKSRLDDFNTNINRDDQGKLFLDLASMNNHLTELPIDSIVEVKDGDNLYVEVDGNNRSIYLIVNKFFSEKNRSEFVLGDNKNRILSEDYIGLKYTVDRKYFDEGNEYGFLTFNAFNDYEQTATLFYGTPKVQFVVDSIIPVALTNTGNSDGMGEVKNQYTKIVSTDMGKYPINDAFELTINSFYEQEYIVPIALKKANNELVKNVVVNLSRFAFGGNAGGLLLVDDNGINCRQEWNHPNCTEDNIYISTSYRGLIDTFYSNGTTTKINSFEISNQWNGIMGRFLTNETVYNRNLNFNPWAVAIFYHDDDVIATKSFNLGELVKIGGFTEDIIPNSDVNNKVREFNDELITNYNSANYNVFGYGLGYEKPINIIKYFDEGSYRSGNIDYTLILASKEEIITNNVNRIALFLTNGELKPDEENFPELTYGVGEGKIFELDGRVFEELGDGE